MTDDEINERLLELLPPDQKNRIRVLVACNGYADPAAVTREEPTNEEIVCSTLERWLMTTDHIEAARELLSQIHATKKRLRGEEE